MNQRELKQSIEEDPNLTDSEKARKLNALCAPYTKMSDAELLQLVRDFTMEYGREPMLRDIRAPYYQMSDEELLQLIRDFVAENGRVPERKDLIYDVVIKQRFGPWGRAMERAGVRPVAQKYLEKKDGAPKGSS